MNPKKPWLTPKKVWTVPSIVVTLDGSSIDEINIAEAMKDKRTLTSIVMDAVKDTGLKEFFVLVNGSELDQKKADSFPVGTIRTIELFSEEQKEVKKAALAEKLDSEDNIPEYHVHKYILGSHRVSDTHRTPEARREHENALKSGQK